MGDKSYFEVNIASVNNEKPKVDDSVASDVNLLEKTPAKKSRCGVWLITGLLASSIGLAFLAWRTDAFSMGLSSQLTLRNGTRLFEAWSQEPVTTTHSFYIFNYTNIKHFEAKLDPKLIVKEAGPYSYTVQTEKVNVVFNDNGTVSYQERKMYKFAPELSKGSLSDVLFVPNIPYMSALNEVKDSYVIAQWALSKALSHIEASTFMNVTAKDFLWGYEDTLSSIAAEVLKYQNKKLPFKKFGLIAGKNGTLPDVITINTGEQNLAKKGIIDRFNGEKGLHHWATPECNKLDAYAGSALPPFLKPETLQLYTKDACRRIPLKYRYAHLTRGVPTYRYELPEDFLSNEGENECYCSSTCLPAGVLNVSACAFGAPVLVSKPHFLHGDRILHTLIDGLQPDEELHRTYMDVEPNMGLIVDGATTAQMNIMVRSMHSSSMNDAYPDMLVLPVMWVKIKMDDFPTSLAWELRSIVALFSIAQSAFFYGPLLMAIICVAILLYRQYKTESRPI